MQPRSAYARNLAVVLVLAVLAVAAQIHDVASSAHLLTTAVIVDQQSGPVAQGHLSLALPMGAPAIQPHLASSSPMVATFTTADASQYALVHGMPENPRSESSPVITRVMFATSAQVSAILNGENTGLPDNYLLCYVELTGTFAFAGPQGTVISYQKGFEVFDAHTGNLLMAGGL